MKHETATICLVSECVPPQALSLKGPVWQLRVFDRVEGDLSELVDAFFVNDPYYPRPVPGDPLYDSFQRGYLSACPAEHRERAALFLQAIEAHHAENRLTTTRQAK